MNRFLSGSLIVLSVLVSLAACTSPSGKKVGGDDGSEHVVRNFTVEISKMVFSPAELRVRKGDKVTFVNLDMVAHDVTEESTKAWTSSALQNQQTWTHEFNESANYYCSLHPVMKGSIIVE